MLELALCSESSGGKAWQFFKIFIPVSIFFYCCGAFFIAGHCSVLPTPPRFYIPCMKGRRQWGACSVPQSFLCIIMQTKPCNWGVAGHVTDRLCDQALFLLAFFFYEINWTNSTLLWSHKALCTFLMHSAVLYKHTVLKQWEGHTKEVRLLYKWGPMCWWSASVISYVLSSGHKDCQHKPWKLGLAGKVLVGEM